jgi:hypothetical protein
VNAYRASINQSTVLTNHALIADVQGNEGGAVERLESPAE